MTAGSARGLGASRADGFRSPLGLLRRSGAGLRRGAALRADRRIGAPREEAVATRRAGCGRASAARSPPGALTLPMPPSMAGWRALLQPADGGIDPRVPVLGSSQLVVNALGGVLDLLFRDPQAGRNGCVGESRRHQLQYFLFPGVSSSLIVSCRRWKRSRMAVSLNVLPRRTRSRAWRTSSMSLKFSLRR